MDALWDTFFSKIPSCIEITEAGPMQMVKLVLLKATRASRHLLTIRNDMGSRGLPPGSAPLPKKILYFVS